MGQNGLLGKQSLYEHSVGVPMLIIDPRSKKHGFKTDALCYLYDLYPTLCDIVGIEIPASVTGVSLKPLLEGTTDKLRDDIFLAYSNQQRALVKDDYKYIIYNVEGKITEQLFNLKKDPKEMANLADAMPQKAAAYKEMLTQRLKKQQDFCNIDTPLWWKDGHKITWDELINLFIFE